VAAIRLKGLVGDDYIPLVLRIAQHRIESCCDEYVAVLDWWPRYDIIDLSAESHGRSGQNKYQHRTTEPELH